MTGDLTRKIHEFLAKLQRDMEGAVAEQMAAGAAAITDFKPWVDEYYESTKQFLDDAYAQLTDQDARLSPEARSVEVALHRLLVQPFFLNAPTPRWSIIKPFGYPGDYQLVERLFDARPTGSSPLGVLLEAWGLQCGPSRSHRARRPWACARLAALGSRTPGRPLQVLSFACGPERILRDFTGAECALTLCDFDAAALEYAAKQMVATARQQGRAAPELRSVRQSAYRLIKDPAEARELMAPTVAAQDGFDAVLVLGLLDYLDDAAVQRFVGALATVLRPGGELLLSNLHVQNPWRSFMEYAAEWTVAHRTVEGFERLVHADGRSETLEIGPDGDSGTNLFYVGRRVA